MLLFRKVLYLGEHQVRPSVCFHFHEMDELKRDLCLGVVRRLAISEKAALKAFLVLVVQYRELGHLYNNLPGYHSSCIMTVG